MRASDAERERVVAQLEREFAAGRLTMGELEHRIGAAHAARTREQLRALTHDLPSDPVPLDTAAAGPDRCLLCLLLCVFPPAGIAYWLACRPRAGTTRHTQSDEPSRWWSARAMAGREGAS